MELESIAAVVSNNESKLSVDQYGESSPRDTKGEGSQRETKIEITCSNEKRLIISSQQAPSSGYDKSPSKIKIDACKNSCDSATTCDTLIQLPTDNTAETNVETNNAIMISAEDLEAAGLDIDNLNDLSEEQMNLLMSIGEERTKQSDDQQLHTQSDQTDESNMMFETIDSENIMIPSISTESLTMTITDQGDLKLTHASGETFFFSATQLQAFNIDVNNLTDSNIQHLVHLAMPDITLPSRESKPLLHNTVPHRAKKETAIYTEEPIEQSGSGIWKPSTSATTSYKPHQLSNCSHLVGEQIEIRRPGQDELQLATIRYVRNMSNFKVQFEDGHFEWVENQHVSLRNIRRTDHDAYISGPPVLDLPNGARVVHSGSLKRLASSTEESSPKRKKNQGEEEDGTEQFCCPICDKYIHGKPSFIVIRIPCCAPCTQEKMVIEDEDQPGRPVQL